MSSRLHSLDTSKGLFIILMTLSHIALVNDVFVANINHDWFLLFKMPGFYIISGYLMYNSISRPGFIVKKIDGIFKPYLSLVFCMMFVLLVAGHSTTFQEIYDLLLGYSYGLGNGSVTFYPAWFIVNLPVSYLFCKIIISSLKAKRLSVVLLCWLALVVFNYNDSYLGFRLPFHMNISLYAVTYLLTGMAIKHINFDIENKKNILLFGSFFIAMRLMLPNEYLHLDLAAKQYNNFFATYAASVSGVLFIISLASTLNNTVISKVLSLCAQNSLYILVLHIPVYTVIKDVITVIDPFYAQALQMIVTIVLCVVIALGVKEIKLVSFFFKPKALILKNSEQNR
ncbi:acyltransferase [Pseudescherichia vulneris]|uniref:acyltransferase n=1 Tax=Pseudescherichia vulneris TaxID=566 RepID=UPI0028D4425E|nr:acyltransferase [Pseudescherichia vulneris]